MKNKMNKKIVACAGGAVISLSLVSPSFGQTNTSVNVNAGTATTTTRQLREQNRVNNLANKVKNTQSKGDLEITNRIDSLNKLIARIQEMKKLSDSEKSGLISNIQTVLTDLTTLKTKIDSDTSTTTLKTEVKSITADYRVYALVLPQISLLSASDRIDIIASEMQTLSAKLQTRISDAQGKGVNVTAASNSLNDLNAKIADASSQAKIINQDVLTLTPDGGDKTKEASNTAALKDARAKLKIANSDLKTARQDVDSIVKVIKSVKENNTASSTAQ